MKTTYYLILGKIVGKRDVDKPVLSDSLFQEGQWVPDTEWAIQDRLIGYDPTEPSDSPYGIGNTSIMDEIEEISEEEAIRIVNEQMKRSKNEDY